MADVVLDTNILVDLLGTLFPHLSHLPREISLPNGDMKPIEWADAIHVATAMSRDEPWLLAATDASIKGIGFLQDKIV